MKTKTRTFSVSLQKLSIYTLLGDYILEKTTRKNEQNRASIETKTPKISATTPCLINSWRKKETEIGVRNFELLNWRKNLVGSKKSPEEIRK